MCKQCHSDATCHELLNITGKLELSNEEKLMVENMKLGTKILCGFGIITFVLITAVLTLVGQGGYIPRIQKKL
ncbi:MAG: hypothetical protein ACYSTS_09535 [Planctomycetota bacterium]|jgi:hypothetical protein